MEDVSAVFSTSRSSCCKIPATVTDIPCKTVMPSKRWDLLHESVYTRRKPFPKAPQMTYSRISLARTGSPYIGQGNGTAKIAQTSHHSYPHASSTRRLISWAHSFVASETSNKIKALSARIKGEVAAKAVKWAICCVCHSWAKMGASYSPHSSKY